MSDRINDKIGEIERFSAELEDILPDSLEDYTNNSAIKAACERFFEKIVMAIIDLSFLIVKDKGFKIPEEENEVFDVLASEKIISEKLKEKLKSAKGMRNVLAHEYGEVNDELVFESLKNEILKDNDELIKSVKILLKKRMK